MARGSTALVVLGGVALALVLASGPPPSAAVPAAPPKPKGSGFELRNGVVVVTDPTSAFEYIAALDLFRDGVPSAEVVLTRILAEQFPNSPWPPKDGEAARQWDAMVEQVAAILDRKLPPPPQRLRIVK